MNGRKCDYEWKRADWNVTVADCADYGDRAEFKVKLLYVCVCVCVLTGADCADYVNRAEFKVTFLGVGHFVVGTIQKYQFFLRRP